MPIYEYRCSRCGHQQEFLQKLSDPPHTRCTKCGEESFSKMVTAAGFQLKGSGWYATDFKGGAAPAAKADGAAAKTEGSKAKSESAAPACGSGGCPACQ
jgi:putative FmdB family regulatory protein